MKFILGQKIEMSRIFIDDRATAVTLIKVLPCQVTQLKTQAKDKYNAVQLGLEKITKAKKIKKPMKGKEYRYLKEFRIDEAELNDYQAGKTVDATIFSEGDKVKVSAVSKGKGYQGAVKMWGFHGRLSVSHGTKHELRTLGSVGSSDPDHVRKGRKMSGRMGAERITVRNLKIAKVDKDNNILAIEGAVPGRRGSLLEIVSIWHLFSY